LRSLVSLNIHNLCKDINLISPVYFIHGGKWPIVPDQKIEVNAVMRNYPEFDSGQDILEGALVYRIQRKRAEFVQEDSKHVWLLVAWHHERAKGLHVCALLVEHNKQLDVDRLKRLCQKHWPLLKARANVTKGNWALNDTTMLTTTIRITNRGYRWDVFISEERK
jgi:hypothetical protein